MLVIILSILIVLYILGGFFYGTEFLDLPMWQRLAIWVPLLLVAVLAGVC